MTVIAVASAVQHMNGQGHKTQATALLGRSGSKNPGALLAELKRLADKKASSKTPGASDTLALEVCAGFLFGPDRLRYPLRPMGMCYPCGWSADMVA